MKRISTAIGMLLGAGIIVGILSCASSTPPVTANTQLPFVTMGTCCDTMYISVFCLNNDCKGMKTGAVSQALTNHSMLLAALLDSCSCGPDTTVRRVVGVDSMRVTKSGSWVTAYFSATTPIVDSLSVGGHYLVVFRKI